MINIYNRKCIKRQVRFYAAYTSRAIKRALLSVEYTAECRRYVFGFSEWNFSSSVRVSSAALSFDLHPSLCGQDSAAAHVTM